ARYARPTDARQLPVWVGHTRPTRGLTKALRPPPSTTRKSLRAPIVSRVGPRGCSASLKAAYSPWVWVAVAPGLAPENTLLHTSEMVPSRPTVTVRAAARWLTSRPSSP